MRKRISTVATLLASLAIPICITHAIGDVGEGECDGKRPNFEAPDYQAFGGGQVIAGTQWRADDLQGVLNMYDLTGQSSAPLGVNWVNGLYSDPSWTRTKMGQLFGVALDDVGNVYVSQTAVYLQDGIGSIGGQPGQVYKVDSATGAPTVFATLPNVSDPAIAAAYGIGESYPQLGNLCFDTKYQMLYVSNFEDGRIYRINAAGVCQSTWDHATGVVGACTPEAGDQVGPARLGERVWAVQNFNDRLYYSLWVEDQGAPNPNGSNEIWSIAQNAVGDFIAGTEQLEISVPSFSSSEYSAPVADLSFSPAGKMMLAERTMYTDTFSGRFDTSAHGSRGLEYVCVAGGWTPSANTFDVGSLSTVDCAGGVDYSYGATPDDRVWFSSDAIILNGPVALYGIQGIPQAGGAVPNSILIDMDADILQQDKTGLGSVEVSCPEDFDEPCATITAEEILCDLDDTGNYTLTFTLTNNSGQPVKHLLVLPTLGGATVVPSGLVTLPNILPDGGSTQVTLTFNGGTPGEQVCFILSLNTVDFEECCAIEYCFTVPDCDCAQIHDEIIEPLCDGTGCFTYTFDVDNLTNLDIYYSFFSPISPAGITFNTGNVDPNRWDYPPMVSYGTQTVTVTICGAQPGEEVCFLLTIHNQNLEECCSIKVTVIAPECEPTPRCPADCNGDGVVDFFDISMFITEYFNQDPRVDYNNDGQWNFFDLSIFLAAFGQGCP